MRCEISHRGSALGYAELTPVGLAIAEFEPVDAYDSVRQIIREASRALWAMGFFGIDESMPTRVPTEALSRASALNLEMKDTKGTQLHPDFINIIERRDASQRPVLFARFRMAHAGTPSAESSRRQGGSGSRPDA